MEVKVLHGPGKGNRQPNGKGVAGQQPGIGRPVEDMRDEFRERIVDFRDSGYVAHYHLAPDAVTILAVRHQ